MKVFQSYNVSDNVDRFFNFIGSSQPITVDELPNCIAVGSHYTECELLETHDAILNYDDFFSIIKT